MTDAIQLVTVRERAAAAGISPATAASLLAPVPVTSVELGHVAGRSSSDETAVTVMTIVLFFCISIFGSMVLTGVLDFDRPYRLGSRTTSSMMQTSGALTFAADGDGTVMSSPGRCARRAGCGCSAHYSDPSVAAWSAESGPA